MDSNEKWEIVGAEEFQVEYREAMTLGGKLARKFELSPGTYTFGYMIRKVAGNGEVALEDVAFQKQINIPLTNAVLSTDNPMVGEPITVTVSPADAEVTYKWRRVRADGKAVIIPCYRNSYTPSVSDLGCKLQVTVTGKGEYEGGITVTTVAVVSDKLSVSLNTTDSIYCGQELTAEAADNATATYQWYRYKNASGGTGILIDGAVNKNYTTTKEDAGYYLGVVVNGTGNYAGTTASKRTVEKVQVDSVGIPAVSVDETTSSSVVLNIETVPNAAGYLVEYSTNSSFTASTTKSKEMTQAGKCVIDGLDGNKKYYFRVKALGDKLHTDSNYLTISCSTAWIPIDSVSIYKYWQEEMRVGGRVTPSTDPSIDSNKLDVVWYRVDSMGNETQISTSYVYEMVKEDCGCRLKVTVTGKDGYTGTRSYTSQDVVIATPIRTPSMTLTPEKTGVSVRIARETLAEAYEIQYVKTADDPNGTFENANTITFTKTTGIISDLSANTEYKFRIRALTASGSIRTDSEFSESQTLTTGKLALSKIAFSGTPEMETELICNVEPGASTVTYEWYRVDKNGVETKLDVNGNSYIPGAEDKGCTLKVIVTGMGDYSGTLTVESEAVQTKPIATPQVSLVSEEVTATSVVLDISAVENAAGYVLEYSTNSSFVKSATTFVDCTSAGVQTVEGLAPQKTYYFRVRAIGEGVYGNSGYSDVVKYETGKTPLKEVTLSTNSPQAGVEITVNTLAPEGAEADYQWYRVAADGNSVAVGKGASYIPTKADVDHLLKVVAEGKNGYTLTVSSVTANTVTANQVSCPVISAEAPKGRTIVVDIASVENASGYIVMYSTTENFEDGTVQSIKFTSAGEQNIKGVKPETVYFLKAQAIGNEFCMDSAFGATVSCTTPEQHDSVDASAIDRKVTVTWDVEDASSANTIRYRAEGTERWTTRKVKAGVTSMTFNGQAGKTYEVQLLVGGDENNIVDTSVQVLESPKLRVLRDSITSNSFAVEVFRFDTSNLPSDAEITIEMNGESATFDLATGTAEFASGASVAFADGVVTFTGLNASTQYRPRVSFRVGNSESSLSCQPSVRTTRAPYEAPANVTAEMVSDTKVTVRWDASANAQASTKYTVEYRVAGTSRWTRGASVSGTECTLNRMKGGTEYEIRVTAARDSKLDASQAVELEGTVTTKLTTPKITTVQSTKSQIAKVSWNVVTGASEYILQYRQTGTEEWMTDNVTISPESRKVTAEVAGLESGCGYEFQVLAVALDSGLNADVSAVKSLRKVK